VTKRKTTANHATKLTITLIVVISFVIGELFLYTWSRVQCVSIGYEIIKLKKDHRQHLAFQENLKIEIAHLKSPKRIARIAANQLDLTMPAPQQVIIIP